MFFRTIRKVFLLGGAASISFLAMTAYGAGFYVQEQSTKGLGRAFSGEVAYGGDASVFWYNPAASTRIKGNQFVAGFSVIAIQAEMENKGTSLTYPGAPAAFPLTGDKTDPFDPAIIPNLHLLWSLSDKTKLGFSMNAPYGLIAKYNNNWFGRYDSTNSELKTINNQFSIAHDFGHGVSLGVGIDIQYAKAVLENALPNLPNALVPAPADGHFKVEGDDVSFGYNIGMTWQPIKSLVLGAHYRSRIEHELEGSVTFSGLSVPLSALNNHLSGRAPLKIPDIFSVGLSYDVDPRIKLFLQVDRFGWRSVDAVRIQLNNGTELETALEYRDVYRWAAGMEYQQNDRWTWRLGAQWDPTPTRSHWRSTRIPDANRTWITGGLSYNFSQAIQLDASIAYIDVENTDVRRTDAIYEGSAAATTSNISARLSGNGFIGAIGISWSF